MLSIMSRLQDSCSASTCTPRPSSQSLPWLAFVPAVVLVLVLVAIGLIVASSQPHPRDDGNGGGWWRRHDRPPKLPRPDLPSGHASHDAAQLKRSHRRRPRPANIGAVHPAPCASRHRSLCSLDAASLQRII